MDEELQNFFADYYGINDKQASGSGDAVTSPKPNADVMRSDILRAIIDARYCNHLTQAALAEKLGTTQPIIARIESGRGNPRLRTLLAICEELGVQLKVK